MGEIEKVSEQVISTQPVHTVDWHPDKLGLGVATAFDQTVRVLIVTKLHKC
jgi:hypothetical protein